MPTCSPAGSLEVPSAAKRGGTFVVDTAFSVIAEDADYLVLEKPAPLAVHAVGAYAELNLHSLLKKDPRWAGFPIGFAHRLDAETSGVILATKNREAASFAGIEFLTGRVKKTYRALVFGKPEAAEGTIDLPLGRDLSSGFQTVRVHDPAGETALTRWKLLESNGGYSWLDVMPETGRTHQIRAHLSLIGHPVVGDKIYVNVDHFRRYVMGGLDDQMLASLKLPRLALHATCLEIRHPATRESVRYESACPDFRKAIAS